MFFLVNSYPVHPLHSSLVAQRSTQLVFIQNPKKCPKQKLCRCPTVSNTRDTISNPVVITCGVMTSKLLWSLRIIIRCRANVFIVRKWWWERNRSRWNFGSRPVPKEILIHFRPKSSSDVLFFFHFCVLER